MPLAGSEPAEPIDFVAAAGELVAVAGAAAPALLAVIAGLSTPAGGPVLVDGAAIDDHDRALAAGVALIPSGNGLARLLTAYENVVITLVNPRAQPGRRGAPEDPAAQATAALSAVGLLESRDHLIEELSGGQQQRVAIARALARRPRVLLADQATTDLDPANRSRVIELWRASAADGTCVVVSSDDPAVIGACDRVLVLDDGSD